MSRSPLAYPLVRGVDGDSGGAADLQTDIMRFMAILALCLVAIFALVQSLPMAPQAAEIMPVETVTVATTEPAAAVEAMLDTEAPVTAAPPLPAKKPPAETVALTRPKWTSSHKPVAQHTAPPAATRPIPAQRPPPTPAATASERQVPSETAPPAGPPPQQEGFTLRFASDRALTRLVATGQVGFYAIASGRARRMTVSESRINFWEASTPGQFHEMESATVPAAVVDALGRSGAGVGDVRWGVTLPGKLSARLQSLMQQHPGGALVIAADGTLDLEPT